MAEDENKWETQRLIAVNFACRADRMFEDKQLVEKLKKGDKQALCRIYDKYSHCLLATAMGILRDRGLAEDAMHDVFLEFVREIDGFVLTGKLNSYLAKCVANRSIDILRSKDQQTVELEKIKAINAESSVPEKDAVKNEELEKLDEALSQLPIEQRQVIMMHIHGQMGYRQIAKHEGVSINTIQGRYRYGMKKLKTFLSR